MFLKRTISTIFLLILLVTTIVHSKGSMAIVVFLVTSVLVAFGLLDFMYITNRKGSRFLRVYGISTGLILHGLLFSLYISNQPADTIIVPVTVLILIGMFLIQLFRQDIIFSIHGICTTITGILYVVWMFSYLLRINYLSQPDGRWIIFMLIIVTKSGDIFAYLVGSVFGKHKLISKISPGKTIEGTLGGIAGSIVVAVLVSMIAPLPEEIVRNAPLLGLLLGIFGQIGDLCESMLKRNGAVKDSGQYIPGMGGALDLLDSMLFTAPIMYYYLRFCVGVV